MENMKQRRINTTIFTIIGIIVGYASFLIDNRLISLAVAIIILLIAIKAVEKVFKITEKKWWSSPVVLYIFTWIVVWTIFLNLYGLAI